nr:hypothetical protein pPsy0479a_00060 [Pseudomonas syringae]
MPYSQGATFQTNATIVTWRTLLHFSLQDMHIPLAYDELDCRKTVVGHAQSQMSQLDQIMLAGGGGMTRRMAMPVTDVTHHASRSFRRLFQRLHLPYHAPFERVRSSLTIRDAGNPATTTAAPMLKS